MSVLVLAAFQNYLDIFTVMLQKVVEFLRAKLLIEDVQAK